MRTFAAVLLSLLLAGCAPASEQAGPLESDSTGGQVSGVTASGAVPAGGVGQPSSAVAW